MLQGVGAAEMNAGHQPVIGISTKYQDPGVYSVEVCCIQSQLCTYMQCVAHAGQCSDLGVSSEKL